MLKVTIVNPDSIVFEGEVSYLVAPTSEGTIGILPGHTPFFGELISGNITVLDAQHNEKSWQLDSGLLKVQQDTVTILIGL